MATIYDKTDNFNLNLYGDNDPADLRDGYNDSMRTIDGQLETHLNRIEKVEAESQHDVEVLKALAGDNTVDAANASKNKWDKAASDSTNNTAALTALGSETTDKASANKTKWDKAVTDISAFDPKFQTLETKLQTLENRVPRNIVLLGDSWTQVHNNALYNRLRADNPTDTWHNYGVGGAVIQQLPDQVNAAKADTGLKADEVTDVIIVMGTNNVFWTNLNGYADITQDVAYNSFKAVKNYFRYANIRYFPNNSKTLNDGRNSLYRNICEGARLAGVGVIYESLIMLAGRLWWFNGNDQEGVQHLSDQGYAEYADHISSVINGGTMISSGWIGTNILEYDSPSSSNDISDNTIVLKRFLPSQKKLETVGWLTNSISRFTYFSNETVSLSITGKVNLIDNYATDGNSMYLYCENWSKRIAPNTLPYIFLGGYFISYYLPTTATNLTNGGISTMDSSSTQDSTAKDIYIGIPKIETADNSRQIAIAINNALTNVLNFKL